MQKLLAILITIFSLNLATIRPANAIVGLTLHKNNLRSIGVIASGGGGATFVGSLFFGLTTKFSAATAYIAFTGMILGPVVSTIGLIILDDKNVNTIEFKPIDLDSTYSLKEIEIYNSEIDELNAIKSTIEDEISQYEWNDHEANKLWLDYSEVLSPETVKIAQDKALRFLKVLN